MLAEARVARLVVYVLVAAFAVAVAGGVFYSELHSPDVSPFDSSRAPTTVQFIGLHLAAGAVASIVTVLVAIALRRRSHAAVVASVAGNALPVTWILTFSPGFGFWPQGLWWALGVGGLGVLALWLSVVFWLRVTARAGDAKTARPRTSDI